MATMSLKDVNKIYPSGVHAVYDFNLDIKDGEFIVFVGPSGCGKSTTLRMIAGLEEISSGTLTLDGKVINDLAPKDRDIAMVFQNYALYSHMSVYHNMAFSLVLRHEKAEVIHERVMWAADVLGLTPYLNRRPQQLSGGQRQRVAVGRAIVRNPKVFLLDEPLSNLDAKLRGIMRKELKLLHSRLKATMIYVTHDQIEALTLADRIVVMNAGYILQIATPSEIYVNPANLFVANFIGTPPMNIFKTVINDKGEVKLGEEFYDVKSSKTYKTLQDYHYENEPITLGIRPEHILIEKATDQDTKFVSTVTNYELLGHAALVHFMIGDMKVISKVDERLVFAKGDKIRYAFNMDKLYFFNEPQEDRIYDDTSKLAPINTLRAELKNNLVHIEQSYYETADESTLNALSNQFGTQTFKLYVRPEDITYHHDNEGLGEILDVIEHENYQIVKIDYAGVKLNVKVRKYLKVEIGQRISIKINLNKAKAQ